MTVYIPFESILYKPNYYKNGIIKFILLINGIIISTVILYVTFNIQNINSIKNLSKLQITKNDSSISILETLNSAVKIFCLINSSKKEIQNRAIHINATWAKRCTKYVFLTYQENINLPFLKLNVPETRHNLWDKWRAALKWTFDNELNNFDFFLRADDDSYFLMENLRFMLLPYDPKNALYFGARFKFGAPEGYMSGGAGVILTREALKQIVPKFDDPKICPQATSANDDLELGICAQNLNIASVDTRDFMGRHRMLPWSPEIHFINGLNEDHFRYLFYPYNNNSHSKAFECCSEYIISFHYVYKEMLYMLEFLFYHAKIVGSIDKNYWNFNVTKNETLKNAWNKLKLVSIQSTFNTSLIS